VNAAATWHAAPDPGALEAAIRGLRPGGQDEA
jgi:hypothetical protein